MDAIKYARLGDLNFFKEAPLDVILNVRDEIGDNVLSIVAFANHIDCCQVICERCPSLSRSRTREHGYTAMAHATPRGYYEIMKLIIRAGLKADRDIGAHEVKTLMLSDYRGDTLMLKAVRNYKTKAVKILIEADTDNELQRVADCSNNTPLHWAVGRYANLEIAKLLIEADPHFPYRANNDGQTPLLIAIKRAELNDSPDMLKLILELQPSQCNVRFWTNGRTALHYAVSNGLLTLFEDIIWYCVESLEVVDNEGQNFLHIAVESEEDEMVEHILGMKSIASGIFNWKDNLGRTPLDVAALSQNKSIILCLLKNPRVDNMLVQTKYFHWVVETHNFGMMKLVIEAIPNFLKGIESEVLQNSRDEYGDTILFHAAQENHLFLCKELYEVCPSLIYHQSKGRCTALHHAAVRGEPEMLKFLIDAGAKAFNEVDEEDIESGGGEKLPQKMLLTMVDEQEDTALHKAVSNHKLEAVKFLIEADPDFQYTANAFGESPLMTAIREAQANENNPDAEKIKRLLYKMLPNQIKARTGDKDWTLLHHAAYKGDVSIIEDIIQFFPSYLDLIDNEGKNFLHIAARRDKVQLVKHVLSAGQIADSVLNGKDNDGNTPLHVAAITGNETLTRYFLFDPRVDKTTVNREGKHVLHAIKFPYDKRMAGVMDVLTDTLDQSDLKDQRDFDLVVGALIATVSFTAGITVPGGYISEGADKGTSVLSKKLSFAGFIISNNLALISSLYAVFSHFCARRLREDADIIYQLNVATFCSLASIYCMMVAFITGSFAVLADSNWLAIVVCVNSCTFFIFSCFPMWRIAMQSKRSTAASQHKRST